MGAIGPSIFLTRDFVQYILPTVLALLLFAPFVRHSIDLDLLVGGAIVSGYFVSAFVSAVLGTSAIGGTLDKLYQRKIPGSPGMTRAELRRRQAWWSDCWDFDALFYSLSKEDREYAYLTRAYSSLFYVASFYFLVYFAVNVIWLVVLSGIEAAVVGWSFDVLAARTPGIGGWSAPTLLIVPISYLAFQASYSWYLAEHESLTADWGTYCRFAVRYHRETGGLATGIWGRTTRSGKPASSVRVELLLDGEPLATDRTDDEGRFRFQGRYKECLDRPCALRLHERGRVHERRIEVRKKEVPEFEVDLDGRVPVQSTGGAQSLAWLGALLAGWGGRGR